MRSEVVQDSVSDSGNKRVACVPRNEGRGKRWRRWKMGRRGGGKETDRRPWTRTYGVSWSSRWSFSSRSIDAHNSNESREWCRSIRQIFKLRLVRSLRLLGAFARNEGHTHTHTHRGLARNCSVSRTEPNELEKERYLPVGNSCQSVELIARRTNLSVVEVRGRKEEGARERKLTVSFEENQESKEVLGLAVTGRLEKLERMGRGCMVARETASEGGGGGGEREVAVVGR